MTILDTDDLPWIGNVVDIVARAAGEPWRVALERLDCVAIPAIRLRAVIGAVRWLLGGRARSTPLARRARSIVLGPPALDAAARIARVATAARVLGIAEPTVEAALWSDLPLERPVELPAGRPDGVEVAATANLQLVQRAMRRAHAIELRVWGDAGPILRAAAHRGLLATACVGADGETVVAIIGPLALLHRTAVYGRALGGLVPLLAECDRFALELRAMAGTHAYSTRLQSPVLLPIAPPPLGAASRLATALARDLDRAGCHVTQTPPPLVGGNSLACPDLVVERGGSCWYVELVGFWTSAYLARKVATYRAAGIVDVVFCVDDARGCADDDPPTGAHVIRFRRRVDATQILAKLGAGG